MGKMILQVDVHEILSLVWDHPFVTGLLVLMCTPTLFPVVMYFSPLLISTALVIVLIISTGRAPIKAKEGEMPWWNSKVEEDNSTPKAEEAKHQSRFLGEERFLEWFHSLQSASLRSSPRSSPPVTPPRTPMAATKGQRSLFRPDESAIDFGKEDTTGRQLKGRLDFERSFSFRTGERVAAAAGAGIGLATSPPALSSPTATPSPNPPPMQVISIPSKGNQFHDASAPEMPSMFRYDERSGAAGFPEKHRSEKFGVEKSFGGDKTFTNVPPKPKAAPPVPPDNLSARIDRNSEMIPFGSFSMSDIIDAVERAQQDEPDPEPQCSIFEMGRGAAPTSLSKVSPLKSLTSKKLLRSRSIVADRGGSQGEFGGRGARNAGFGTNEKRQSFLAPQSPGFFDLDSGNATPLSKTVPGYGRSRAYNAAQRAGNAAGYNPSSKTDSAEDTVDRPGLPPTNRKGSTNRENRQSSPLRFWKATSWQTPQTPNRQTSQAPSLQTPQTPSRQTPQTPSRQGLHNLSRQTSQTANRQTSQASAWQTPQTPNRQTLPPTNWNWQAPPSAIWQNSQSKAWDAAPLSNWQSPAHAQPYTALQDSPLPSWQDSPTMHTANTLKTSRSGGVRRLDEYNRYQSSLHSNKR